MEETDEFKWALKVVIKRQMRDLIEQLQENGEEIAIISADLTEESCTHFGSQKGEWFMSEQRNLTNSFLKFCKRKTNKSASKSAQKKPPPVASRASTSSYQLPKDMMSPRVVMEKLDGGPEDLDRCLMRVWMPADVIFAPDISDADIVVVFGQLLTSCLSGAGQDRGDSPMKAGPSTRKTRSGRAVSSLFTDALGSLRKGGKHTQLTTDASGQSQEVATRFEFCTVTGEPVDIETRGHNVDADQLQALTDAISPALDDLVSSNKLAGTGDKPIKVIVGKSCLQSEVQIEVELGQSREEEDNKLDMSMEHEHSDLDMEVNDGFDEELDDDDRDPDFKPDAKASKSIGICFAAAKHTPIDFEAIVKDAPTKSDQSKDNKLVVNKAVSLRIEHKMKQINASRKKIKKKKVLRMKECEICGVELGGTTAMKNHIDRVHKKIRPHKCPICLKGFFSRTALETHSITVHTGKCDSCSQYVVESVPWEEGVTARTVREVTCVCGGTVTLVSRKGNRGARWSTTENNNRDDENIEEFTTPKNKMYACGECGKLYFNKIECEKHAVVHSTKKDNICEVCGAALKSKVSLKNHMAKQHGVLNYPCKVCGTNYNGELALKVHMSREHPRPKVDQTENQNGMNVTVERPVESIEDFGLMDAIGQTVLTQTL